MLQWKISEFYDFFEPKFFGYYHDFFFQSKYFGYYNCIKAKFCKNWKKKKKKKIQLNR